MKSFSGVVTTIRQSFREVDEIWSARAQGKGPYGTEYCYYPPIRRSASVPQICND